MKKAPSIIISAVLVLSMAFVFLFMSGDEEDINIALQKFTSIDSQSTKTTFDQTKTQIPKKDNDTLLGNVGSAEGDDDPDKPITGVPNVPPAPNGSWLDTVAKCKEIIATQIGRYLSVDDTDANTFMVTDWNGVEVRVRSDCSGYVRFCLYQYGLISNNMMGFNSSNYVSPVNGTTSIPVDGDLVAGDILWTSGHVEILAEDLPASTDRGYTPKVFNVGSSKSAANPGITTSSKTLSQLCGVWRVN